jgi:hypothetical protein
MRAVARIGDAIGRSSLNADSPSRVPRVGPHKGLRSRSANVGGFVSTLALAEYGSGHWVESIAAGERSAALQNGGDAYGWFFLAMAHWQRGDKKEARRWFEKAVTWTKEKAPKNDHLRGFWKEAAELLGCPGPNAAG